MEFLIPPTHFSNAVKDAIRELADRMSYEDRENLYNDDGFEVTALSNIPEEIATYALDFERFNTQQLLTQLSVIVSKFVRYVAYRSVRKAVNSYLTMHTNKIVRYEDCSKDDFVTEEMFDEYLTEEYQYRIDVAGIEMSAREWLRESDRYEEAFELWKDDVSLEEIDEYTELCDEAEVAKNMCPIYRSMDDDLVQLLQGLEMYPIVLNTGEPV